MSIFYQNRPEEFHLILSRNNSFSPHLHRHIELILVLSGHIRITIEQEHLSLEPHQGCIIFPNQIHSLHTPSESRILLFIFDAGFCPDFKSAFYSQLPESPFLAEDRLSSAGLSALNALGRLWVYPTVFPFSRQHHQSYTKGFLQILLTDIFGHLPLRSEKAHTNLELSRRVLLYIESHYTEALTLDTLAGLFSVSRFTISRIFSEKLNSSFSSYITGWRLEKARDLLLHEEGLSITDIAYESGFSSTRTFFRAFYDAFRITPRGFRQQAASHPFGP